MDNPNPPPHPLIVPDSHRDTLDRVAHVLALLKEAEAPDGLSDAARTGLFWIHDMLGDAVRHVSNGLISTQKSSSRGD